MDRPDPVGGGRPWTVWPEYTLRGTAKSEAELHGSIRDDLSPGQRAKMREGNRRPEPLESQERSGLAARHETL